MNQESPKPGSKMRSRVNEHYGTSLQSEISEVREQMFRRYGINVPEGDPIFAAYEVQSQFIAHCNEMGEQLVKQANNRLEDTLRRAGDKIESKAQRAFEQVGRQLRTELSPTRIAQEMCKETGHDLRAYGRAVSRSVRNSLLVTGVVSVLVSALLFVMGVSRLYDAERKLARAEALAQLYGFPESEPPPLPPADQAAPPFVPEPRN